MAYTPQQEADARALLAKGDVLGQQAAQQTGVAFNPQYTAPSPQPAPVQQQTAVPTQTPAQTPTTQGTPAQTGQASQQMAQQGQLVYDPSKNPSVVDLLNSVGQPSSFQDRTKMAGEMGVQNYTGSAPQNMELAKKFTEFYNQKKGTEAPSQAPRQEIQEATKTTPAAPEPQKAFMDAYYDMNPVLKTFYDSINQVTSPAANRVSLVEEYQNLLKETGVEDLKLDLININKVIEGTEDDIREEITASGGFATESQIQALAGARNKVLLRQSSALQQTIETKQDYVNQIMNLTGLDREAVERDVDRKLGLQEKMVTLVDNMNRNAGENYRNIVSQVGYQGLAQALQGNPNMQYFAEQSLGLPYGSLSDQEWLQMASGLQQDAKWTEPYALGGDFVQKNLRTGEIRVATSQGDEWSQPYQLGGDYVQKNVRTGEVRTAVNVDKGTGGGGGLPSGGDYSSLVGIVANTGSSVYQQKSMADGLSRALMNGDWATAYQYISQGTQNQLSGENKTKFQNAQIDTQLLGDMKSAIEAYSAAGGNMNILKGSADTIAKNIGVAINDPRYTEIATQLERVFQQYRQNMTGAAFGAQESREYARVTPTKGRELDLNLATISGALNYMDSYVTGAINSAVGPQGVEIKNKASGSSSATGARADGLTDEEAYEIYLSSQK